MKKTISFDHEGGFWKTRYSYVASCYAWIKKMFVTSPIQTVDSKVLWKHDSSAETNNSFYGASAVPSMISITFNDEPSTMKIFKAMSLETTDIRSLSNALNTFRTNTGTQNSRIQNITIGPMLEKGGAVYGHIPTSSDLTLMSFEYLGASGNELPVTQSLVNQYSGIGSDWTYCDLFDKQGSAAGTQDDSIMIIDPSFYKEDPDAALMTDSFVVKDNFVFFPPTKGMGLVVGDPLFLLSNSNINSDQARGFYAEAELVLGSDDFEVFSVNIDYESNPLGPNG